MQIKPQNIFNNCHTLWYTDWRAVFVIQGMYTLVNAHFFFFFTHTNAITCRSHHQHQDKLYTSTIRYSAPVWRWVLRNRWLLTADKWKVLYKCCADVKRCRHVHIHKYIIFSSLPIKQPTCPFRTRQVAANQMKQSQDVESKRSSLALLKWFVN